MDAEIRFNHPVDPSKAGSGFGYRPDPFTKLISFHSGIDYKVPKNTPVFSAAPGTVFFAGNLSGYGKTIIIDHENGYKTLYAHLENIEVKKNDPVSLQTIIGKSGSTGRSTGHHLHFEIRYNDKSVDPNPYLNLPKPIPQKSILIVPILGTIAFFYLILKK